MSKIIGCGSGRCGTLTLKKLFEANDFNSTHELEPALPWKFDEKLCQQKIKYFSENEKFCDVALWHLNYIDRYLKAFPKLKIVVMRRNRKDTIISFLNKTEGKNHFINHSGKNWAKDETYHQGRGILNKNKYGSKDTKRG